MKRILSFVVPFALALTLSVGAGEKGEWKVKLEKKADGTWVAKTEDGKELAVKTELKDVKEGEATVVGELSDDKKTVTITEIKK